MTTNLMPGDRVRLSPIWLKTLTPKKHARDSELVGKVLPYTDRKYIRVLWDGKTKPTMYAVQFVEALKEG